jgi:hypothetical protein
VENKYGGIYLILAGFLIVYVVSPMLLFYTLDTLGISLKVNILSILLTGACIHLYITLSSRVTATLSANATIASLIIKGSEQNNTK